MGVSVSRIDPDRFFGHTDGAFIDSSGLGASSRRPVIRPCQVAAGNIVMTIRCAGVLIGVHGFVETTEIKESDSEIGISLGSRRKNDGPSQDFNGLLVISHQNVDTTEIPVPVRIVGRERNSLIKLAGSIGISGLMAIEA